MKKVAFASVMALLLLSNGCRNRCEVADGPRITQRDFYETISELELNMSGELELTIDTTKLPQMEIIAQPQLLAHIERRVEEERLQVSQLECVQENLPALFSLTCGPLDRIIQGSVGTIQSGEMIQQPHLKLENRGLGDIDLYVDTDALIGEIRSSGDLILGGTAQRFDFLTTSSGDLRATQLICDTISLTIIGGSVCDVYTDGVLNVRFFEPGVVNYYGNPTEITVEGEGTLNNAGQ